ncbi:molybdopterin dinucleotide-binding protein [Nocardia yunnanensis]|uniref:Molybdopterin dinucleotide-binding protein n=1 Tax=Nocardia yunnanensis TaxID=2382165 RepID=A0A386ZKC3_9NOCA|nr:molybdopterin-dependent oxidoreductase [Nocardia yunnanensis]AYF77760.1 molybdopterin dinucleotide-binding protein [Nocardia yunnanensis]
MEIAGYCTLCKSRCGAVYTVENGRLTGARPDADHPTGKAMCPKGRAAPEIVHSTRRLTTPLRRTRPKTDPDPGWEPVSWETALTDIARRLTALAGESGPESVAFALATPSGTSLSDSTEWIERFVHGFGSPNTVYSTEICNWHKDAAHAFTFGAGLPVPDYATTDLAVLWGFNPAKTWLAQSADLAEARARGARLAVIDPRESTSASGAEHWLRVRPGTDAALALGLAGRLIETRGYDERFVRAWTNAPLLVRPDTGRFLRVADLWPGATGYVAWDAVAGEPVRYDTEFAAPAPERFALDGTHRIVTRDGILDCATAFDHYVRACREWPLARVARETWIDEHCIAALADEIAHAESVSYYGWTGIGQHANATQTDRAIATLFALTGSFDAPGGNVVLPKPPVNVVSDRIGQLSPRQRAKTLGLAERPLGPPAQGWVTARDLCRAVLEGEPYRVRALVGFGANLLMSQPDSTRTSRALEALDFQVHLDLFENPTARYADYLLPVNSSWEHEALRVGFESSHRAQEHVQLRSRIVDPIGESRSDMDVVFDLATRMGMGELFFDGDIEAAWNHQLAPLGRTAAELRAQTGGVRIPLPRECRKYETAGFATPTRRVDLYSERLAAQGYSPVPEYTAPAAPDAAFPLVLTCAKNGYFCHSQHRHLNSLRRRSPHPRVDLNPETAAARGITDGRWVTVSTRLGSVRLRARLDASLHPGVVVAEYGWWQSNSDLGLPGADPVTADGSNYNLLVDDEHTDPVSGSVPLRSFTCEIAPVPVEPEWEGTRTFTVAAVDAAGPQVRALRLVPEDGAPLPNYRPGQHLTLHASTPPGDGTALPITRSYSLTGPATAADRDGYGLAIRHVPGGAFSGYVHNDLRAGDRVEVGCPTGSFRIPTDCDHPVVMLASGIGLTPFLSYLETLAATGGTVPEIVLHYGVSNSAHHSFRDRLHELATALGPRLRIVTHYSRPLPEDRIGLDFDIAGRIRAADVYSGLLTRRARFYLCGPAAMLSTVTAQLRERGVPGWEIFSERFATPARTLAVPENARYSVRFTRSGRELTWTERDGTLLEFAEKSGLALRSGCRVGQCESCLCTVRSGSVGHFVDTAHLDDDACLPCQAVPASDLEIDA